MLKPDADITEIEVRISVLEDRIASIEAQLVEDDSDEMLREEYEGYVEELDELKDRMKEKGLSVRRI